MQILRIAVASVASVGLALSLVGCSSSEDTSDASATFCEANANARLETAALKAMVLDASSTVDQVQDQADAAQQAVADANDTAADLAEAIRDDVEAADDAFNEAIAAIPGDATLPEAAAAYQAAVDAWDLAVVAIRDEVGCS